MSRYRFRTKEQKGFSNRLAQEGNALFASDVTSGVVNSFVRCIFVVDFFFVIKTNCIYLTFYDVKQLIH